MAAPGRAGVAPSLSMTYGSGNGNGPVGFGWSLGVAFIGRQLERGVPRYRDAPTWTPEEDRLIYSDGGELVPIADSVGTEFDGVPVPPQVEGWQQYRPQVMADPIRVFRAPDWSRWVVQASSGQWYEFGELGPGSGPPDAVTASEAAAVRGPGGDAARWLLSRACDPHGSCVYYEYAVQQGDHYLTDVYHLAPASCAASDPEATRACAVQLSAYGARMRFVYEQRPDVLTSYATGFALQTTQRLKRVEVTSAPRGGTARTLVRRYHLQYDPRSHHSLVSSVQLEGRPEADDASVAARLGDASVAESALGDAIVGATLPALQFSYVLWDPTLGDARRSPVVSQVASSPSVSITSPTVRFFDVNSDGLPDVIDTDATRYQANGTPAVGVFFNGFGGTSALPGAAGSFSSATPVPIPSGTATSTVSLSNASTSVSDVTGDGLAELLHLPRQSAYTYFVVGRDPDAQSVSPAHQSLALSAVPVTLPAGQVDPRIDFALDGQRIRVFDVNNDGLADIVKTTGSEIQTWLNLGNHPGGNGRYGTASHVGGALTLDTAPLTACLPRAGTALSFQDSTVRIADMNGDGVDDIVRLDTASIVYWPGRGDGRFGVGEGACSSGIVDGQHVSMGALSPLSTASSLIVADIDMDGAADIVRPISGSLSIWLNRSGRAFSSRIYYAPTSMPIVTSASAVRILDVNGSGTADVVFGTAGQYKYIDVLGGQKPRVLARVQNGLGATTTFEYGSSAQDYLRDLSTTDVVGEVFRWRSAAAGCDATIVQRTGHCVFPVGGNPSVSTVLRAATSSDGFGALGRAPAVARTEYAYHDPYYEGAERESRGFRVVDKKTVGDAAHPSSIARTYFHQAARPSELAIDRLAPNPNRALAGKSYRDEVLDETGRTQGITHTTYAVRHLMTGLDGRRIDAVIPARTDRLTFDVSSGGAPTLGTTVPLSSPIGVIRQVRTGGDTFEPDASWPGESHALPQRHSAYAHVASTVDDADRFGHARSVTAWGRLRAEDGSPVPDERIVERTDHAVVGGWRWLHRPLGSRVEGHGAPGPLRVTWNTYDETTGEVRTTRSPVTLPQVFEFAGDARGAVGYTQTADEVVVSRAFDAWGNNTAVCSGADLASDASACLRYKTTTWDPVYADVPIAETVATGTPTALTTEADWDRGLGAVVRVTDANGASTTGGYDGLGRPTFTREPKGEGGPGDAVSTHARYVVTTDPVSTPVSYIERTVETSSDALGSAPLVTRTYFDALGRQRASLVRAEAPYTWLRSGVGAFSAAGSARATYPADAITSEEPSAAAVVAIGAAPSIVMTYDAFGRARQSTLADGTTATTIHHALAVDSCDALDFDTSNPKSGTCRTVRSDGHGRVIDTVQRNRVNGGPVQVTRLFETYRADGALVGLVRAETQSDAVSAPIVRSVSRSLVRDSLGRLLAATDEDADARRPGATAANRTWRFLYNRAGDVVAVRDPRGCGQNDFRDRAGRLLGTQYVTCDDAQPTEGPVDTLPAGAIALGPMPGVAVHARTYHDSYPAWATGDLAPPEGAAGALGRVTAEVSRGARRTVAYDGRGQAIQTAHQAALLSPSGTVTTSFDTLASSPGAADGASPVAVRFDGAHTYTKRVFRDHAGRTRTLHLPRDPDGGPDAPSVSSTVTFNRRGLPNRVRVGMDDSLYTVVDGVGYDVEGRVADVRYGDTFGGRPPTLTSNTYDARGRLARSRTTREPSEKGNPFSLVTVLSDQVMHYDAVDNLVALDDRRVPEEWPDGHRPRSVQIAHDALSRVTGAAFSYTDATGSPGPDLNPDWRAELALLTSSDPMRRSPAPGASLAPNGRALSLSYAHDFLGNTTSWTDDAKTFHERSLGRITNGNSVTARPSALHFASDLPETAPKPDSSAVRGGFVEMEYGDGGFVRKLTVAGQCRDVSQDSTCFDGGEASPHERADAIRGRCACAATQHYTYAWDELGRLVEARRYDGGGKGFELAARMRYRYDAGPARTAKESWTTSGVTRVALTVFEGDVERRGLEQGADTFVSPSGQAETQYLTGGARIVWRRPSVPATYEPGHRIAIAVRDGLGSTVASFDGRTGDILEAGQYLPSGVRESFLSGGSGTPSEPSGFTGKEADEEVGLTYFGHRYLLPHLGRWASPDPKQIHEGRGGEALNNYHYVAARVFQATDPTGLEPSDGYDLTLADPSHAFWVERKGPGKGTMFVGRLMRGASDFSDAKAVPGAKGTMFSAVGVMMVVKGDHYYVGFIGEHASGLKEMSAKQYEKIYAMATHEERRATDPSYRVAWQRIDNAIGAANSLFNKTRFIAGFTGVGAATELALAAVDHGEAIYSGCGDSLASCARALGSAGVDIGVQYAMYKVGAHLESRLASRWAARDVAVAESRVAMELEAGIAREAPGPQLFGGCFVAGTPVATARGHVPIEALALGARVEAGNPACTNEHLSPDARQVRLALALSDAPGETMTIEMIREPAWVEAHRGRHWAELAEIGVSGWATMLSDVPAPREDAGVGCLVRMRTERRAPELLRIALETGATLDLTPGHPLFVEGRGWTKAGEVETESALRADGGPIRVRSVTRIPGRPLVYNLEVSLEHTYRVGLDRVWAHNQCSEQPRGLWDGYGEGTAEVARHGRFGKFAKHESTGLWWSRDNAGHGDSAWKVFRESNKGLEWIHDADEFGDFIVGKHKGPTGTFIPWSELH